MAVSKDQKRAAKAAWGERKADWSICAVRVGDAVWVKGVSDPAALERRLSFMLRTGGSNGAPAGMQAAFHEAGVISVEVVEKLDEDLSAMARETAMKDRLAHWAETLNATPF
ncbi:MAG: hypothetical protein VX874_10000 [Pseudomonadota bacterium]|nr:hypothetical protein [Pseudomonadota bacterium]